MSIYVKLLLLSRNEIKNSVENAMYAEEIPSVELQDLYDDLLMVEKAITEMYAQGLITRLEIIIINFVSSKKSFRLLEKNYNISRITISKKFNKLCNKIGFYLGDYFTNAGYLHKLIKKYNLTYNEAIKVAKVMKIYKED